MTFEFKSRRQGATARQRQLVEEARASRKAEPRADGLWVGFDLGSEDHTATVEIPQRHPDTGIGE